MRVVKFPDGLPAGMGGMAAGVDIENADNPSLAIASDGTPYVAYRNSYGIGGDCEIDADCPADHVCDQDFNYCVHENYMKPSLAKLVGNSWEQVGDGAFSEDVTYLPNAALDSSDVPYMAYMDGANGYKATVKKLAEGAWVSVPAGIEGFTPSQAMPALAIDAFDLPSVAFGQSTPMPAQVMVYHLALLHTADEDGDGVPDEKDNCDIDPNPYQADADKDGLGDACEEDADNDGVADEDDNCPFVANPGDPYQADADGDGIGDACDNCPDTFNDLQEDADNDGVGDVCDSHLGEFDNDGVDDEIDNCPLVSNPLQEDEDGDGIGDACDPRQGDFDNDGVGDDTDNCDEVSNVSQKDVDLDGVGDACDPDSDNDGVDDEEDNCPFAANADQKDTDHDGQGNACDDDDDGDGIPDGEDLCPLLADPANFCADPAPRVTGVQPGMYQTFVGPRESLFVSFSETIDEATITSANFRLYVLDELGAPTGEPVALSELECNETDGEECRYVWMNPASPLLSETTYGAFIRPEGITDLVGQLVDVASLPEEMTIEFTGGFIGWSFTVALDTDGDGIADDGDGSGEIGDNLCADGNSWNCDDNCPAVQNENQNDGDRDGVGDACDPDADPDGDGIMSDGNGSGVAGDSPCYHLSVNYCDDNCPTVSNPLQEDEDGDRRGDACEALESEPEGQSDGILDDGSNSGPAGDEPCTGGETENCDDNCPLVSNPLQEDEDGDGVGDDCDSHLGEYDNDGVDDVTDNCPSAYNPLQEDGDSNGVGDACEWVPLGKPFARGAEEVEAVHHAVDRNGIRYVAYFHRDDDENHTYSVRVKKYDGTGWVGVGGTDGDGVVIAEGQVSEGLFVMPDYGIGVSFAIGPDNTPYVGYVKLLVEYSGDEVVGISTRAEVMKFARGSGEEPDAWVPVGDGFELPRDLENYHDFAIGLALDPDGTPYLSIAHVEYSQSDYTADSLIKRYDEATGWTTVTGSEVADWLAISIAADAVGNVYWASFYPFDYELMSFKIYKYDGASVTELTTVNYAGDFEMAVDRDNFLHVAYLEMDEFDYPFVKKFVPGSGLVAVGSLAEDEGSSFSLAFAPNNTPFLAYRDWNQAGKATVLKYSTGSWQVVGVPGFSPEAALPAVALDPDGVPSIAYGEYNYVYGGAARAMVFHEAALADADADGVPDKWDNCDDDPNWKQEDADDDGTGDACEGGETIEARADTYTTGFRQTLTGNVMENDCAGNDCMSVFISVTQERIHGAFDLEYQGTELLSRGSFTYTPDSNFFTISPDPSGADLDYTVQLTYNLFGELIPETPAQVTITVEQPMAWSALTCDEGTERLCVYNHNKEMLDGMFGDWSGASALLGSLCGDCKVYGSSPQSFPLEYCTWYLVAAFDCTPAGDADLDGHANGDDLCPEVRSEVNIADVCAGGNVAPACELSSNESLTYSVEAGSTLNGNVLSHGTYPFSDADGDSFTAALVRWSGGDELTLNADGSFSYAAPAGQTGDREFSFKAVDEHGAESVDIRVKITITTP